MENERLVTTRPVARDFFQNSPWALTLAPVPDRRFARPSCRFLTFAKPRAVPPALPTTVLASVLRGPIPAASTPEPPSPRGGATPGAAIPGLRTVGSERALTVFQQTQPTPRPGTPGRRPAVPLHPPGRLVILRWAHGRDELPDSQVAGPLPLRAPRRLLGLADDSTPRFRWPTPPCPQRSCPRLITLRPSPPPQA